MPVAHDIARGVEEVEWLAGQPGIRGVMIPTMWRDRLPYNDAAYDPVWAACEAAGFPVHTHSGEAPREEMGEHIGIYLAEVVWWATRPMWHLLFSGAFERFPKLKFVVTEAAAYWATDMMWKWDQYLGGGHTTKKMAALMKGKISKLPSDYFGTNIFIGASTMSPEEIRRRHILGCDVVMWGTDYPHPEGTWPHTMERLRAHFADVPVEDTRKLLGETAAICYGFDLDELAPDRRAGRTDARVPRPGPDAAHRPRRGRGRTLVEGRIRREGSGVKDLNGKVAVVTGGAAGIGRGLVEALLEEGVRVVIADIEAPVLDATVTELADRGEVRGVRTDVSDPESFEALAEDVFATEGACHLLFNNAGVTSGGGGKPWEQEANDWRWCFAVNVFGMANGVLSFVPRMLDSGEPGIVVNTSSGDGGIAPVPYASIYASSKAAVTCFTESLAHQLAAAETNLRAAIFYPSGGLAGDGPLDRAAQSAGGAGTAEGAAAGPRHDVRRVQGAARGRRPRRRRGRPAGAGPLRTGGGEGRAVRDQPRPGPGRKAASRPGRRHR